MLFHIKPHPDGVFHETFFLVVPEDTNDGVAYKGDKKNDQHGYQSVYAFIDVFHAVHQTLSPAFYGLYENDGKDCQRYFEHEPL